MKSRLSNEQIEATKAFFMHYDWDWNTELIESEQRNNEDQSENFTPFIAANFEAGICDQCLCSPCVLDESNRQTWWPLDNMVAKRTNNATRKILYKKFWTMLCHRGVFQNPTYIERRSAAIARDKQRNYFVWHNRGSQRDLLPNCCSESSLVQYMGHLWF